MSKRDVSSDINLSPVQLINVALLDYMNNMGVVSLKIIVLIQNFWKVIYISQNRRSMAKRNYGATPGMRLPSKRSMAPARLCQVFNAALSSSPDSGICKLKIRAP